jgi:hypothetical protein
MRVIGRATLSEERFIQEPLFRMTDKTPTDGADIIGTEMTDSQNEAFAAAIRIGDLAMVRHLLAERPALASSPLGGTMGARTALLRCSLWGWAS